MKRRDSITPNMFLKILEFVFLFELLKAQVDKNLPTVVNPHHTFVGKTSATLSWSLSEGSEVKSFRNEIVYLVYDKEQNPFTRATFTIQTERDVLTATITGLRSGTTYEAQIHTKTDSKDGPWSTKVLFTTTGVRPPRTLNIRSITDKTATVDWTPPIGVIPEFYVITLKRSDNKTFVPKYPPIAYPATEFVLWNLEPESPYTLFIQAQIGDELSTKMKMGFATDTSTVLETSNEEPTETSVLIRWKTITFTFLIARYDIEIIDVKNTDPKTRQKIVKSEGNEDNKEMVVKGLKPATIYSYRVRSIYSENGGRGKWSKVKYFTTKFAGNIAPPTVGKVINYGKSSAKYAWNAPASTPVPITHYEIKYGKQNQRPEPLISTTGPTTSYLLGNLESGTMYTTMVRAMGDNNVTGNWSTETVFTTNGPKPVSAITITEIKDTSAIIGWIQYSGEKADSIKIVIIESQLQITVATKTVNASLKSKEFFSGLKPVTGYRVEVYSIKNGDESSAKKHGFATNTNLDTLSQQPMNPAILKRGPDQPLSVLFYEFDKIPNKVIKYYTVQIEGFDIPNVPFHRIETFPPSIGGSKQSVKLDKIQSGYKYKIKSRGIFNDDSQGKWSTVVSTIVPGPRPIRAMTMREITHQDVTVSWESGYDSNDVLFSQQEYTVTLYQYGENDNMIKIDEHLVSGIKNEDRFVDKLKATMRYKVVIFTRIRSFPKSSEISTAKELAFRADSENLKAPKLKYIARENSTIIISWVLLKNRKDINHYEIQYKKASEDKYRKSEKTENGNTNLYRLNNVIENTHYLYRVRAVDNGGKIGRWLDGSFDLNHGPTEDVKEIKLVKKSSSTVTLTWKAPESTLLKMYEIELWSPARRIKEIILTKTLTSEFTLEDLHPETAYFYKIRTVGINENIRGPWSQTQSFSTAGGSDSSSLGIGLIIAIAVGALVLLIIVVVALMIYKKRRNRMNHNKFNVRFSRNDAGISEIS